MSFADLIILALIIAIIVGGVIVGITLIRNIKVTSTSPTLSPAPAAGASKTPSGGGGSSGKSLSAFWSIIPLVLAGLWLGAKIILWGGEVSNMEIFILAILAILAWGLDQKKWFISVAILVILGIKLLTPPEMDPIVIDKDGVYDLPNRPLKVCFTQTGDPAKTFYVDQQIIIEDIWQITRRETGCDDIPESVSGKKVRISLGIPGKQYTPEIKKKWGFGPDINNDYDYYGSIGVSQKPFIQAR